MKPEKELKIMITWDEDAQVWFASSEDVQGLVLKAGSYDALIERVRFAVPDLLEVTDKDALASVPLCFISERRAYMIT